MVVSESCGTGRTLLRFLAIDASGETERCLLSEIIPPWIYDVVVKVRLFHLVFFCYLSSWTDFQILREVSQQTRSAEQAATEVWGGGTIGNGRRLGQAPQRTKPQEMLKFLVLFIVQNPYLISTTLLSFNSVSIYISEEGVQISSGEGGKTF